MHDIEEARLLSGRVCVCLRSVVKSSDSGLPKSCTTFQTQMPFTPADSIGRAPSRKKHGARVSILCEGVQRGAAEKRCRIMAFHRLKFCGPKVLKLCLSSCRCLQVRSHDKHGCCNLLSMRAGGRVLNGSLWDLHLIWKPTGQSFSNCRCKLARTSEEAGAEATPGQLVPQFGELATG